MSPTRKRRMRNIASVLDKSRRVRRPDFLPPRKLMPSGVERFIFSFGDFVMLFSVVGERHKNSGLRLLFDCAINRIGRRSNRVGRFKESLHELFERKGRYFKEKTAKEKVFCFFLQGSSV